MNLSSQALAQVEQLQKRIGAEQYKQAFVQAGWIKMALFEMDWQPSVVSKGLVANELNQVLETLNRED